MQDYIYLSLAPTNSFLGLQAMWRIYVAIFNSPFHKLKTTFNRGLESPTHWDPFVAATMLRRPEPTKEKVEPTILSVIAIEITHFTMLTFQLLLRILRYMWCHHGTTWLGLITVTAIWI